MENSKFVISEGYRTIRPELAQYILEMANYGRQRPIYAHHVASLVDKIVSGSWVKGHAINFARLNGNLILVNGQHRLKAVVEANKAVEFMIVITNVKNEDELHRLYCSFDTGGRARTANDIILSSGICSEYNLSKTVSSALYMAANFIEDGFVMKSYVSDPKYRNIEYRMRCVYKWAPYAHYFDPIIKAADSNLQKKLRNSAILAVALLTFKYQTEKAVCFWSSLARQVNLTQDSPQFVLARYLRNTNFFAQTRNLSSIATAKAWNSFFYNRKIKQLRASETEKISIAGTPFE
jgi:hypothetical protein